jgi:hypothetical protein
LHSFAHLRTMASRRSSSCNPSRQPARPGIVTP